MWEGTSLSLQMLAIGGKQSLDFVLVSLLSNASRGPAGLLWAKGFALRFYDLGTTLYHHPSLGP